MVCRAKIHHPKDQKPNYNPGALVPTHNMASRELIITCINTILTKFQMRLLNFGHIFRGLGGGGGGHLQSQNWTPATLKTLYKVYMRSFPITNGVQCTNAYSQIHYIHIFLNKNVKHTGRPNVKIGVSIQANFSKKAERKETPLTWIQVQLKLSSNQETHRKSVHSTTRYFNIKAPYQTTKMTHFGSCFCTIT